MNRLLFSLFLSGFATLSALANVRPNSLFSDNAVLQRGVAVPVWGTAADGETVTVSFAGQSVSSTASGGKWFVKLKPLSAGGPYSMTIRGQNTITINNLLVGEVWLCSGQSNMAFPLRAVIPRGNYPFVDSVLAEAARYPMIREFAVPLRKNTGVPPLTDESNGTWRVCNSRTAKDFSAVAYFFARDLYSRLQVPIGIVKSAYGGTAIENWINPAVLAANPDLNSIVVNYEKALHEFPAKLEAYTTSEAKLLADWKADSARAAAQKVALPRKPAPPMHPAERGGPGGLYNTMIHPLLPFAIRGMVWYQGEANASRGIQYRTLLPMLIDNWRSEWGQDDVPFLFVQIPGWRAHHPELREAQLLTWQQRPNTAMTVINDCDDTLDVHPPNKQPVGERLALAARQLAYGEKIEYSGPVYEAMQIKNEQVFLQFSHLGGGLVSPDPTLTEFTIAGADKVFVPALAVIRGKTVVVSSDRVKQPVAVRYGWRLSPQSNLYNKAGLPATPFRTDLN